MMKHVHLFHLHCITKNDISIVGCFSVNLWLTPVLLLFNIFDNIMILVT